VKNCATVTFGNLQLKWSELLDNTAADQLPE